VDQVRRVLAPGRGLDHLAPGGGRVGGHAEVEQAAAVVAEPGKEAVLPPPPPLSGPASIKSDQDLAQAKSALDEAGTSLKQSHTIVDTELPHLGQASQKLRAEPYVDRYERAMTRAGFKFGQSPVHSLGVPLRLSHAHLRPQ
jgi:hypothetical protein